MNLNSKHSTMFTAFNANNPATNRPAEDSRGYSPHTIKEGGGGVPPPRPAGHGDAPWPSAPQRQRADRHRPGLRRWREH